MIWECRERRLTFERPLVMGILNLTPDSFSDGGRHPDLPRAVAHGEQLVADGADLLDLGGESTRPGAAPVSVAEEIRRVLPVLESLRSLLQVPLSVDTRQPEVASAALAAGADIINDVGANRTDPALWRLVAEARAGYVAMHMQGSPATMQREPRYDDVAGEVNAFFLDRLQQLKGHGVPPARVVLDPGIGFGKTVEHNLELLRRQELFDTAGRPILWGVSRKSFLARGSAVPVDHRLPASLACTLWCAGRGARIFRTHDVAETVQALRLWDLLGRT